MAEPSTSETNNRPHSISRRWLAWRRSSAARDHGAGGLRQCESTHVTQKRVGRRPGMIRLATRLIGPPQVGQRMRQGIVDLDLGLIGGDLVDDVAVGRGERTQDSVAALIDVGRITFVQKAFPRTPRRDAPDTARPTGPRS